MKVWIEFESHLNHYYNHSLSLSSSNCRSRFYQMRWLQTSKTLHTSEREQSKRVDARSNAAASSPLALVIRQASTCSLPLVVSRNRLLFFIKSSDATTGWIMGVTYLCSAQSIRWLMHRVGGGEKGPRPYDSSEGSILLRYSSRRADVAKGAFRGYLGRCESSRRSSYDLRRHFS